MRKIFKGEDPTCLDSAERNGWTWDEFVAKDHDGYLICREQANTEQQGVCAYTELPLDVEKVTVHFDHFRKKSIYPKLRFKWDNLFAAVKDKSEEDIRSSFDGMGFLSVVEQEIGYMFA